MKAIRATTRPVLPPLGLTHRRLGIFIEKIIGATVSVLCFLISGQRLLNHPECSGDEQALELTEVQTIETLEETEAIANSPVISLKVLFK